jgi:glycerol kinase
MILALDQGTTSSRAILFDDGGHPLAVAQEEFPQIYPSAGWIEHDPERIWQSQVATARRVLSEAGVRAAEVDAVGIANQRETTVVWERATGRPIHNAIVWQDRRTSAECDRLRAEGAEGLVAERAGLLLDPYFSATKAAWLLDAVPDARARAERGELCFGTIDSYLIFRLTGGRVHATDATNASRTSLLDIRAFEWDEKLLRLFRVPRETLPKVCRCDARFGDIDAEILGAPLPICGVLGDQQAATFGQRCVKPGMVKNTYGTGSFLLVNVGDRPTVSRHRLLSTPAWRCADETAYALEGSVFVAGSAVQWLRDQLGIIRRSSEVEPLALSVADSGGVYFVPAFVGLGAPHWDPYARGALVGLTRGTGKAHIARAALEAVAFQTRDVVDAMRADSPHRMVELRADGGMAANDTFLQLQADLLGLPVVRPASTETTALGAALMAARGCGKPVAAEGVDLTRFEPSVGEAERDERYAGWKRAVERARNWAE